MSLIAPKGEIPELEIKDCNNPYNMISIVGGVPLDSLTSKSKKAPTPDIVITRNQAEIIESFGCTMLSLDGEKGNIAASRLIFFATSKDVDRVERKIEIVIADEPLVEKEIEDKDDDEEAVEDYGDEEEEVVEED